MIVKNILNYTFTENEKILLHSMHLADLTTSILKFLCIMFSLSDFALIPISVFVVITAVKKLLIWRRNRAFADSHGCKPPRRFSRIQNIRENLHANTKHAWLNMWYRRYSTVAPTFESATVGFDPIIFTNEPENIKTILATDFSTFDLGHRRKALMDPIVGPGIFSSDGQAWRHSRVCPTKQARI